MPLCKVSQTGVPADGRLAFGARAPTPAPHQAAIRPQSLNEPKSPSAPGPASREPAVSALLMCVVLGARSMTVPRRASRTPRSGGALELVTIRYCGHPSGSRPPTMQPRTDHEMRTALRQAGAITAVDGQHSMRRRLGVAHQLYEAMLLLDPQDRARRIQLIDSIFTQPRRGSGHSRRDP